MILSPVLLPAGITAVDAIRALPNGLRHLAVLRRPSRRLTSAHPSGATPKRVWPRLVMGHPTPEPPRRTSDRQQREFDVEPVAADVASAPRDRPGHPIFHRVEMQVEFLGGDLSGTEPRNTRNVSSRASFSLSAARSPSPEATHSRVPATSPPRRATTARPGGSPRSPSAPAAGDQGDAAGDLRLPVRLTKNLDTAGHGPDSHTSEIRSCQVDFGTISVGVGHRGTIRRPTHPQLRSAAAERAGIRPRRSPSSRRNRCSRPWSPLVPSSGYPRPAPMVPLQRIADRGGPASTSIGLFAVKTPAPAGRAEFLILQPAFAFVFIDGDDLLDIQSMYEQRAGDRLEDGHPHRIRDIEVAQFGETLLIRCVDRADRAAEPAR